MNARFLTIVSVVWALSIAVVSAQDADGWKIISAGKAFTFRAPADTMPYSDGSRPIDSFVGMYRNSGFTLMFDYGAYSNNLSGIRDRNGYTTERITIDGRDAVVVSGSAKNFDGCNDYMSAVYLTVSRSFWSGKTTKLMMSGCTKDRNKLPAIRAVFQSLRFLDS